MPTPDSPPHTVASHGSSLKRKDRDDNTETDTNGKKQRTNSPDDEDRERGEPPGNGENEDGVAANHNEPTQRGAEDKPAESANAPEEPSWPFSGNPPWRPSSPPSFTFPSIFSSLRGGPSMADEDFSGCVVDPGMRLFYMTPRELKRLMTSTRQNHHHL
jgi:hypothetical protein